MMRDLWSIDQAGISKKKCAWSSLLTNRLFYLVQQSTQSVQWLQSMRHYELIILIQYRSP